MFSLHEYYTHFINLYIINLTRYLIHIRTSVKLNKFFFCRRMCAELASWLVEITIVEHLFGPNLHVEVKYYGLTKLGVHDF